MALNEKEIEKKRFRGGCSGVMVGQEDSGCGTAAICSGTSVLPCWNQRMLQRHGVCEPEEAVGGCARFCTVNYF